MGGFSQKQCMWGVECWDVVVHGHTTLNVNVGADGPTVLSYDLHGVALVFYALGHVTGASGTSLPRAHL